MVIRLGLKTLALFSFFVAHYLLNNALVVTIVEVLHLSPLPLCFPWSLSIFVSMLISALVAIALYRSTMRMTRRGRSSVSRA